MRDPQPLCIHHKCAVSNFQHTLYSEIVFKNYDQRLNNFLYNQLPSVGAGNVLKDIISSDIIPCFRLTQVFRQAKESLIIQYAHQINKGETPYIASPFKSPAIWKNGADCLFIDSDEATQEQLGFISRVKRHFDWHTEELENLDADKVNQTP